jgi:hypothetical protein
MVCVKAAEVLGALLASPLYVAVIEWTPDDNVEIVSVAS